MRSYARIGIVAAALLSFARMAHAQVPLGESIRENLGGAVNTASIEILPIVSPDGSTLYFDRKYDPGNIGGADDEDDIYFSTRMPDSSWSVARNIGPPLNTRGSDVLYWISSDGNTALVHHGAPMADRPAGMAIARRRNGAWTAPVPLRIEGVGSLGDSYYAFVAPDLTHLLVAFAPRSGAPRDMDIFVCDAIGSDLTHWGAPRSLGATINTTSFDGAPFLASDDRTLYFASDGRGGIGSSDLFVSRRLDSGWTKWTEPVNMGGNVNTARFDASLSIPADGRDLYISGAGFEEDQGFGKADIFRIALAQQFRPVVVVTVDGRLVAGTRGVRGLVRAERTSDRTEIASAVSGANGRFQFTLPAGVEYRITGGADGYVEGSANVDARGMESSRTVATTISLEKAPAVASHATSLEPAPTTPSADDAAVHFASGSAELSSNAVAALERRLATIGRTGATGTAARIVLVGHTDDVGEEPDNVELARRRAGSVRAWLVAHGVDAATISVEAAGESDPVAPNSTARGRALNRRVDVQMHTRVEGVIDIGR
jgi:outer membrane protein OmpA-like peptidoglycan-associated protein